jgi:hypothetical protein
VAAGRRQGPRSLQGHRVHVRVTPPPRPHFTIREDDGASSSSLRWFDISRTPTNSRHADSVALKIAEPPVWRRRYRFVRDCRHRTARTALVAETGDEHTIAPPPRTARTAYMYHGTLASCLAEVSSGATAMITAISVLRISRENSALPSRNRNHHPQTPHRSGKLPGSPSQNTPTV